MRKLAVKIGDGEVGLARKWLGLGDKGTAPALKSETSGGTAAFSDSIRVSKGKDGAGTRRCRRLPGLADLANKPFGEVGGATGGIWQG